MYMKQLYYIYRYIISNFTSGKMTYSIVCEALSTWPSKSCAGLHAASVPADCRGHQRLSGSFRCFGLRVLGPRALQTLQLGMSRTTTF